VSGHSLHRVSEFKDFDLSYRAVARIDEATCIQCDLCYVACNDTAHQCIDLVSPQGLLVEPFSYDVRSNGKQDAVETRPQPRVREADCVGCRLCYNVCPVDDCIAMVEVPSGREPATWSEISRQTPAVTEDWEAMKAYRERVGINIH
jgi:dihydropyrimidine dehydrogenase (NAD+) subunit PreA